MPTTLHPPRAHAAPPAGSRPPAPPRRRTRRRLAVMALMGLVAASVATYAITAKPWLPAPGAPPGELGAPSPLMDVPPLRLGGR